MLEEAPKSSRRGVLLFVGAVAAFFLVTGAMAYYFIAQISLNNQP
ncbi:MAG: hypothetical protein V4736_11665 [Bdellovibrionota bacterium]